MWNTISVWKFHYLKRPLFCVSTAFIGFTCLFQTLIAPPPPPVATGPGLDRPLFTISPDYADISPTGGGGPNSSSSSSYTMARTRKFYQDQQLYDPPPPPAPPSLAVHPHWGQRSLDAAAAADPSPVTVSQPRRMESLDSALGGNPMAPRYGWVQDSHTYGTLL